jgi:hypothetical protein
MNTDRRSFFKTTLAASSLTALTPESAPAADADGERDYYDLRAYRLKSGAARDLLDRYLSKALIPALNQRGIAAVGVFTEVSVDKRKLTSKPLADSPVWVLIPHPSLESFAFVSGDINNDPTVQAAGADYLRAPKSDPAFERIDSWLLRAFKSLPRTAIPAFSGSRAPGRIFELRDYQSHSEERALNKMAMFDEAETQVMKEIGLGPVFFGQALSGRDLPHLRYMTGAADLATHLANWKKFGPHPIWQKIKGDPRYKDNTSKNTSRFIVPTAYSQI